MPKRTPKSWTHGGVRWIDTDAGGYRSILVNDHEGNTVAHVMVDEDDPAQQVHADLIVAAPDLADALEDALRAYEDPNTDKWAWSLVGVRAALKKAGR